MIININSTRGQTRFLMRSTGNLSSRRYLDVVTEDVHEVGARQYEISDRSELRIRYGDKWWETRKKKKSKDIVSSFTLLYMTCP